MKMSDEEIPEIPEWANKLSAAFASGEFSMEKATASLNKSIEDIKNGNITYTHDVAPTITYKKRKKWTK